MYGDFPAKNTVCTRYIPINVWSGQLYVFAVLRTLNCALLLLSAPCTHTHTQYQFLYLLCCALGIAHFCFFPHLALILILHTHTNSCICCVAHLALRTWRCALLLLSAPCTHTISSDRARTLSKIGLHKVLTPYCLHASLYAHYAAYAFLRFRALFVYNTHTHIHTHTLTFTHTHTHIHTTHTHIQLTL